MKSSALIKCSGHRERTRARLPLVRWVVRVVTLINVWPSVQASVRFKQYQYSSNRGFKSPLRQHETNVCHH